MFCLKNTKKAKGAVAVEFALVFTICVWVLFIMLDIILVCISISIVQTNINTTLPALKIKGHDKISIEKILKKSIQEYGFSYIDTDSITIKPTYFEDIQNLEEEDANEYYEEGLSVLKIDLSYEYKFKQYSPFKLSAPNIKEIFYVRLEK